MQINNSSQELSEAVHKPGTSRSRNSMKEVEKGKPANKETRNQDRNEKDYIQIHPSETATQSVR